MATDRIAVAQRGVVLSEAFPAPSAPRKRSTAKAAKRKAPKAAGALTGPFLSPGSLTRAERLRLIEGIETVIDGVYTHLPLKRARYGTDPGTTTAHPAFAGRRAHRRGVPSRAGRPRHSPTRRSHSLCRTGHIGQQSGRHAVPGRDDRHDEHAHLRGHQGRSRAGATFRPGVVLEYWNGVPIDRAVQRYSESEVGGRPDSQRAWATQSLTLRSLQYSPPPDEEWVIVGYRSTTSTGMLSGAGARSQDSVASRRPLGDRRRFSLAVRRHACRCGFGGHGRSIRPQPQSARRRCCCSLPACMTGEAGHGPEAGRSDHPPATYRRCDRHQPDRAR